MFICSTTSNLNNFKPQQLKPQKRVQNEKKKQNRRPPFICFNILQHNGCEKIAKGPPFTFFGTVTLFKNLNKFFCIFFHVPKGSPFNFFHFLQPAGVSQSPKGPPFSILSLRYGADFGRSRLVDNSDRTLKFHKTATQSVTFFRFPVKFRKKIENEK